MPNFVSFCLKCISWISAWLVIAVLFSKTMAAF
jgi:hypothetical protein